MQSFETSRLLLRPYAAGDAGFVFDLYSRWEVQRFLGLEPRVMQDPAEAAARIEAWTGLDDGTCGVWAVGDKATGQLAGSLLLKSIPASAPDLPPSGDIEIGWHFHPDSWGRGYAAEAAAAILRHGLRRGLPRIVAVINPENGASRRVCEKIGLHPHGLTGRYYNATCELFSTEPPRADAGEG